MEAAALLVLYAFVGFENSVVPAGETDDPRRTIPRALIATIVATAAIYFLVQLAYVAVMPAGAAPEAPLAAFAAALVGPAGALILAATALASIAGNVTGSMTATPRVTYALAGQGSLPGWFGGVSPRWATPANSVLFMGLAGVALGGQRQLRLARHRQHARAPVRLCGQHRRLAQGGAAGAGTGR